MFALRAEQEEFSVFDARDSAVVAAEPDYTESFVDQGNGEWAEIKSVFKRNKLLKSFFKVFKYFKKLFDLQQTQLNEQKKQIEGILSHQKASGKDIDRQDKQIKHMQQSIFRQNKYEGG